ncbi:hypothetical protein L21SP5_01902 [Salinivirga cyanobacteriivorans]|uniref:Uncharacterized protein n=2 Tax=Salinivirga cyanobacteriivorans TaxID=1307839 RepID=A0A0S2I046_9BACT|nr:hypothetical protein L21SP5_01902 [Salinivirga cyanobacteriivorans]
MHTSHISIGTEGYYSYGGISNLNKTEAQLNGSYEWGSKSKSPAAIQMIK